MRFSQADSGACSRGAPGSFPGAFTLQPHAARCVARHGMRCQAVPIAVASSLVLLGAPSLHADLLVRAEL